VSRAVIVTRSQPGADETAEHLAALGYRAIVSPMLHIVETGLAPEALEGVRDLVFTSANGVRAFRSAGARAAGLSAWCVGPSTAAAAEATGFARVIASAGNADRLGELILARSGELHGPVLHIANTAAAGDLVAALRRGGLEARLAAPYRTELAPALSDAALETLLTGGCAVLIHSARAAEALRQSGAGLGRAAIAAISEAAAAPLAGRPAAAQIIAAEPNEAALMNALQSVLPLAG
jgi:uroporphyrinogen-III synthase